MTLLYDITQSIKDAGGRMKLAYKIILENPESFTKFDERYFRNRVLENERRRVDEPDDRGKWSDEDLQYLLDNYGIMKTSRMASALNRTAPAIRIKFAEIASDKQKANAMIVARPWKKKSNFKSCVNI